MKNNFFKRFFAIIAVILCVLPFIGVLYCVITGSKYLMPMIFVAIAVPMIIYLILWIKRVFSNDDEERK